MDHMLAINSVMTPFPHVVQADDFAVTSTTARNLDYCALRPVPGEYFIRYKYVAAASSLLR